MNEPKASLRLREFPTWPVEQVMEVMRLLYSRDPIKRELWKEPSRWTSLARQACDFLDHSQRACEEIARQRSSTDYRRAEARNSEAKKLAEKFGDVVPFRTATKIITDETRPDRAVKKLKTLLQTFVLNNPPFFDDWIFGKRPTKQSVKVMLSEWEENGISPCQVMQLQHLFEDSYPCIVAEQNSENARKRKRKRRGAQVPQINATRRELREALKPKQGKGDVDL